MNNRIFIGGLSFNTTEESLLKKLQEFGNVTSLRIIKDHETGKSRGFAFAAFETEEEAKKSIQEMDNQIFEDRRIGVQKWIKGSRNGQG